MADETVVHIGENSPEEVALKLLHIIADVEKRQTYGHGDSPVDREWVLRTYAQCRSIVISGVNVDNVLQRFPPASAQGQRG